MAQTDVLDPEQELRKRIKGQLGQAIPDPAATGGTAPGGPVDAAPFDRTPVKPITSPPYTGPSVDPYPVKPTYPTRPYTGPGWTTNQTVDGGDGTYTPPDPPPNIPPVTDPAAPAAPAPPPSAVQPPPSVATVTPGTVGITDPAVRSGDPNASGTASAAMTNTAAPEQREVMDNWLEVAGMFGGASGRGAGFYSGGSSDKIPQLVEEYNRRFGRNAQAVGEDKVDFGDGRGPQDVLTAQGDWWFGGAAGGGGGASGGGGGAGGGAGAGGGTGGGAGTTTGAAAGANTPDWYNQIRSMLMGRITAAQTPVNESDNYISQPLSAARDEVSRGQDTERKALAERAYAQGDLNSGVVGQQIQQSSERNGTGLSQLRAGLISKEYTARRDELQNYLQLAMASGDAEMARSLQMQISQLNAQVAREGQGIGLAEFLASLNQNTAQWAGR